MALLLVLASSQSATARQDVGSDHFGVRISTATYPAIPGTDLGFGLPEGNDYSVQTKTITNKDAGGAIESSTRGLERGGCTMAEVLAFVIRSGADPRACGVRANGRFSLIDMSLLPRGATPISRVSPYGRTGGKVDELDGRAHAIFKGIRQRVATFQRREPEADPRGLFMNATIEMLANPWASRSTREVLIDSLRSRKGFTDSTSATDPAGRAASVISLTEGSHAKSYSVSNGAETKTYDLTDTVQEHQLFYDPKSLDILTSRIVLKSTSLEEVGAWLADHGGSEPIETEVFKPVKKIHSGKYQQRRIPCGDVPNYPDGENSSSTCIDIGEPGPKGGYIITGE